MNPFRTRTAVVVSFFLLSLVPAVAQQEPAPKSQCVVFTLQDFSAGSENKDYEQPITASVSAALGVGGFDIIAPEKWGAETQKRNLGSRALLVEANAVSVAQAVGADLAVTGYFTVEGDRIYISLQCWDAAADVLAAGLQQTARFNIAFYSSLHDKVVQMLPDIHLRQRLQQVSSGSTVAKSLPTVSGVTFLSPDEGMEVLLAGGTSIGTISGGKLVWQPDGLVLGSRFNVEKRKQGFHTGNETVSARGEVRLSRLQDVKTRALEVDWTLGQLLGMGATLRLYTNPDYSFFFVGNYVFVQPPLNSAGNPVYHYDANLGFGTYLFFPPDYFLRLGISGGTGSTLSIATGPASASFADFYLDVFNWWLETRILGPTIFLRQEFKFAIGGGSSLLGLQWMQVAGIPPITLGVLFRW